MFYHNGVLEVKVDTTGFPFVTIISPQEARYGYRLHDNIYAGIEQTMFNFKVDIDVLGTKNRLKSVETGKQSLRNGDWSRDNNSKHSQLKISEKLQMTEMQAVFKHNSNDPKYLVLYNHGFSSEYKNVRGYRIQIDGGYQQVLTEDFGNEASVSWARYDLVVTNRKEDEGYSSSIYSPLDVKTQIVNFQKFVDDNENILDKDLVSWVTLRSYNIHSTEALPLVQTAGGSKSFYVMPFNYYPEDPSLSARDALKIRKDEQTVTENHGLPKLYSVSHRENDC
ncbi:hypothetical protein FSP39_008021 [Pinctada imbricata]|uniref:Amine oxidase n=1 Tax=Pinctada imbricata TaxID=66713 RepID=A0AA89C2U8_PINIB|nr:hypothetical protein FSP39_008021 [Pinctada imbricata]